MKWYKNLCENSINYKFNRINEFNYSLKARIFYYILNYKFENFKSNEISINFFFVGFGSAKC
jgi:hypothetical protein